MLTEGEITSGSDWEGSLWLLEPHGLRPLINCWLEYYVREQLTTHGSWLPSGNQVRGQERTRKMEATVFLKHNLKSLIPLLLHIFHLSEKITRSSLLKRRLHSHKYGDGPPQLCTFIIEENASI